MADFPWSRDPRTGKLQFRKQQVEIDEALLKEIASETQGKYFRANLRLIKRNLRSPSCF